MGLFGKSEPKPSTPPAASPAKRDRTVASSAAPTLIGPQAKITGEIVSSEGLHIDGQMEGKIRCTKQVVIGERGQLRAEIEAETVVIRGRLDGNCKATRKVEITGTGKVFGNIAAPSIAMAEGAMFRGASQMGDEKKTARVEARGLGSASSDAAPKASAPGQGSETGTGGATAVPPGSSPARPPQG